MKRIVIDMRIADDKIATAWKTEGYSKSNISDNFEILGLIENFKTLILNNISVIAEKSMKE